MKNPWSFPSYYESHRHWGGILQTTLQTLDMITKAYRRTEWHLDKKRYLRGLYVYCQEQADLWDTKHDVRSMHAKVTRSGLGLYAFVGQRLKLYNFWRYKFKKYRLPYPKSQRASRWPQSVLQYHRRWYARNSAKKKLHILRDWSYQLGVHLSDDALAQMISSKTKSLQQIKDTNESCWE